MEDVTPGTQDRVGKPIVTQFLSRVRRLSPGCLRRARLWETPSMEGGPLRVQPATEFGRTPFPGPSCSSELLPLTSLTLQRKPEQD